jgi:hypothetical protein
MLRIRMLLNSARPHPLSSDRTSVLAGPPPLTMLSGIHRGSCTLHTSALGLRLILWAIACIPEPARCTTCEHAPVGAPHRLAAHEHHKLHVLRVRLGRRYRLHEMPAHMQSYGVVPMGSAQTLLKAQAGGQGPQHATANRGQLTSTIPLPHATLPLGTHLIHGISTVAPQQLLQREVRCTMHGRGLSMWST